MHNYYDAIQTLADVPDLHGNAPALIFGECTATYDELSANANRVANALVDLGLAPGARIAFVGLDSEKSYELLFGCARAGMVFVPINWKLGVDEIAFVLDDAETQALFVTPELVEAARTWCSKLGRVRTAIVMDSSTSQEGFIDYSTWRDAASTERPTFSATPDAPVVQVYTSGTSGRPKGVVLAHRGFLDLIREIVRAGDEFISWRPGDVGLLALPTFHVGGLWWTVHNLVNASAGVVLKAFGGAAALAAIERHRITKLAFVPAMLQFVLSEPAVASTNLSSVDLIIYGGSPMPAPLLAKAQSVFRCDFAQNYGLSETTNMAIFMPPSEHAAMSGERASAAGRPLRGVQLRIVDRERRDVAPQQRGEIVFNTPSRMLEYWKRPKETAETLSDGWIFTGDAGYLDADGYLHITDRIKDLIISAGENISPAELEQALHMHPQIEEAAVIGIPDRRWGEVPVAYVVTKPDSGLTKGDVMAHARAHIASFKMLYDVFLVERLPRNSTGKVLKRVLREPHWVGHDRLVN
ncbi:long-chain-fatty-acid--CoA ligase [Trinickia sp. LjRoot230]|uniref:long-chain-fatty-acid--CoA ligase n=1 Tax=Trinickia sp. LjRoot230 TaxID=3342288 RepID=UPI003ED013B3